MASVRATAHPPAADSAASHAQPRVCIRKATSVENGVAKRGAGAPSGPETSPGPEKAAGSSATVAPNSPGLAKVSESPLETSSAETLPLTADSVPDSAPPPVSRGTSAVASSMAGLNTNSTPGSYAAAAASGAAPVPSPPPTSGYRVPFGYVPGAISVELPKRQRTHKHHAGTAAMPRSYSSLT